MQRKEIITKIKLKKKLCSLDLYKKYFSGVRIDAALLLSRWHYEKDFHV